MNQSATEYRHLRLGDAFAERLHDVINEMKDGDALARVTVVTPSFYSSFYLRRWIASHGLLNVEFTRVDDLAELLARDDIRANGGKSMTRLKGAELVREAVAETATDGVFSGLAGNPSFLGALQRTLRELEAEQSGNTTIAFDDLSDHGAVVRSVGDIWKTYQRLKTERNLYDRTQVAHWASKALGSKVLERPWAQLSIGKLVTLAVAKPAPQYRSLWQMLVTMPATTIMIGMTGDERSDAVVVEALDLDQQAQGDPASTPLPPDIVSAADTRSEVSGLVRRIVAAASKGVPFSRIAVYYGNRNYASRVRSALKMAGIPVSGQPPDTLLASPAGRFANGLLEIATSDLSRQKVGDWLATAAVKDPATGLPVAGSEWDRISRSARISSGIERWTSLLERFARSRQFRADQLEQRGDDDSDESGGSRKSESLRDEANQAARLLKFIRCLADDLEHPDAWTWTEWSEWLKGIVNRYLDAPGGSSAAEAAERIRTLLDRIGELNSLFTGDSAHRPDLARFAAVVVRELTETQSGSQKLGRGVFVASVRDAVATQFEQVYVVGMTDGSFPSQDTADPLLPDHVRQELNALAQINLSVSSTRLASARREFMTALRSGKQVTLSWSRASGPGTDDAGPAQWLVEQARTRPGAESIQAGDFLRRPDEVPGLSLVEYGVGDAVSDEHEYEIESVRRHVETQVFNVRHLLENDEKSGVPDALQLERERYGELRPPQLGKWSGDVSAVIGVVPSSGGEILSASRIESFAGCPLRYFFGYVLSVDPTVTVEDDFHMPPDRKGTFIHSVLELYLNLRLTEGKAAGEATLDEAMGTGMARWLEREPDAAGRVWEIETGEIRRQLRRWLAREEQLSSGGYSPFAAELSFDRSGWESDGSKLPPLEIALADGTVLQFSGVIDRVERRDDGSFYVIDYKTGSSRSYSSIDDDPVDRGKHLQLALYSKVIEQFRPSNTRPDAGYWFVLDSKQKLRPDTGSFDSEAASEGLSRVLEVLQTSNTNGHFPPNPGKRGYGENGSTFDNCRYCDFDRVCPSSTLRERMLDGHSIDPKIGPYFDLALDRKEDAQ